MKQSYALDSNGSDEISDNGFDQTAVKNRTVLHASSNTAKLKGKDRANNAAKPNTRARGIAVILAVGLIGLVGFVVVRIGGSDVKRHQLRL